MGFFTDFVNNLKRNFTDPVGLAQDMGKAEAASGIDESKRRFAVADYEIGTGKGSIKPGMYYTKPYEDTRTDAQKDKDERADARAKKAAEAAKKSIVTEVAEEKVETTPATTTTAATTTTPAVQSVLQDADIGLKGGTVANEADIPSQGISKDDKKGLRPKRSVRRVGMLASYQPGASQSLLASA